MTIIKPCIKRIVDYNDFVLKKMFPHIKEVETIIKFNQEMQDYFDDENTNWSRSQFEKTGEVQ